MRRFALLALPALTAFSLGLCHAQVSNLSGTWRLNVDKSKWGKRPSPQSVIVTVEHKEPSLKYSGHAVDAKGESTTRFEFDGAIDGREYPADGAYGQGKMVFTRLNPSTVRAVFRSADGRFELTARTVLSRDGNTMTRRLRVKRPDGTESWTEVYEKRR